MNGGALARGCIAVTCTLVVACAGSIAGLRVELYDTGVDAVWHHGGGVVSFQYLGSGGWLVRRGSDAVLTAPFFSNPGLLRVALGHVSPNREQVERYLPALEDVEVVLAGHSHYDHLMDLPAVLPHLAGTAKIFGNATLVNTLTAVVDRSRLVDVTGSAGTDVRKGEWLYAYHRRVRFMPLVSEHAPHFLHIKFFGGERLTPAERLPRGAGGWKEGHTLAFLIDFLSPDGAVDFRIHYQDAASTPPLGFPPPLSGIDEHAIDVAILCVASFDQVERYPDDLLREHPPRYLLLGHWEDFFTSQDLPVKSVRGTSIKRFLRRLPTTTEWILPNPGVTVSFHPSSREAAGKQNPPF